MLTLDDDLDSSVGFYTGKPSSYSSPSIVLTHNPQDPHQDLWCNELHRRICVYRGSIKEFFYDLVPSTSAYDGADTSTAFSSHHPTGRQDIPQHSNVVRVAVPFEIVVYH